MAKKNYNYFNFFKEMIDCCIKSSDYLEEILSDYDSRRIDEYQEKMHECEHEADIKKHEMMSHLMKEFLPPIDREDISFISHVIDNVCDNIEEAVMLFYINDIKELRPEAMQFAKIIRKACGELKDLFNRFENFKKDRSLEDHIITINAIEEEGDHIYLVAMRTLMTDQTSERDIIIWKDIFNCLENCCDSCEKIADEVELVLMKSC